MELIIGAAFEKTSIGTFIGPNISFFKQFQDNWQLIECDKFQTASSDPLVESLVAPHRSEILEFAHKHLATKQPIDDYREFLQLSIVFLGDAPACGIRFKMPGAMHRARWMAKVIYTIKMWLFRAQFKKTAAEERNIRDLALFPVGVYLRAWIIAPNAVQAPLNDFTLMRKLMIYPNPTISAATSKKLGLHLWYLSVELIGLSPFDIIISNNSKKLTIAAMKK